MILNPLFWFKKKNAEIKHKVSKKLYYDAIESSDISSETKKELNIIIPMLYSCGEEHILEAITTCNTSRKHLPEYILRLDSEEIKMLKAIAQNTIMLKNSTLWHNPLGERDERMEEEIVKAQKDLRLEIKELKNTEERR